MRPEDYARFIERRHAAQLRLARRMAAASPVRTWRYAYVYAWNGDRMAMIRQARNFGHEFGRLLALYNVEQDSDAAEEIRDLLNNSPAGTDGTNRLAAKFNDGCDYSHELWKCYDCGEWYMDEEDSSDVGGNRGGRGRPLTACR